LWWREHDRDRIAQLHDIIHDHLHIISAGYLELDLAEERDVRGMQSNVLKREFDLAFAENGGLVRGDEANTFGKTADTRRPPVKQTELERHHGQMGDAKKIYHADEKKIPRDFLTDLFA
jgi:hypothetical protein